MAVHSQQLDQKSKCLPHPSPCEATNHSPNFGISMIRVTLSCGLGCRDGSLGERLQRSA